jgi:hypothetical protein
MSGHGDQRAERILGRALEGGPRDVLGLLRALRRDMPGPLAGREGSVHALLRRLLRRGTLVAGGVSPRGLTLYRLAEAEAPPEAERPDPGPLDAALAKKALRVAAAVRDPAERGRVVADVNAHLAELAAAGHPRRFGPVRGAANLLLRTDRGKGAVLFVTGAGDVARRLLVHEGPWVLTAVVIFFLLKFFVVSPYKIPSESMVPTLLKHDRVAVFTFLHHGVPERWNVIVYRRHGVNYVKRLVGLPGEAIALWYGDVYADGKLLVKPDDVREALRSHVGTYDLPATSAPGWEVRTSQGATTWTWLQGSFPAFPASAGPHRTLVMHDGYLQLEGAHVARTLRLTLLRGPGDLGPGGRAWSLEAGPGGLSLLERTTRAGSPTGPPRELARLPSDPGGTRLALSYVDGVLRASCGGWSWRQARPAPVAPMGVRVAEEGGAARGLRLRVDRDLHYASGLGAAHGTQRPGARGPADIAHPIAPGHVYCLGDNTTNSEDSRFAAVGDIPTDDIVGSVSVRIWPPGRWGLVH